MQVEGEFTCDICGEEFSTNVEIAAHKRGHQIETTDGELLAAIRDLADRIGSVPSSKEFTREGAFSATTVKSAFESWNDALRAAGYEPRILQVTDEEILDEIQDLAARLDHIPSAAEMDEEGRISPSAVRNHFGSWNDALRAAGFEPQRQTWISPEDVIEEIELLASKLGRAPTALEMKNRGSISVDIAYQRFDSWNDALRAAGFKVNSVRDLPEEELIGEIDRLVDELDHVPSSIEMREHGAYSVVPYQRRWGTWKEAVEAAGHEHRGYPRGPDHPSWKEGYTDELYRGCWRQQRERALERDNYRCRIPGCGMTRKSHKARFGKDITVHHIDPIRRYRTDGKVDYEAANRLDNLLTLCEHHHQRWEQMAPLQPDIRHCDTV